MIENYIYVNGISEVNPFIFYHDLIRWFLYEINKLYFRFLVGFACLPFIWLINSIWFFDEAFRKPVYDEQKSIRRCKFEIN